MLIKSYRGVIVEKFEKEFEDGASGYFCTAVLGDGSMISFWCPLALEGLIGDARDVEGFSDQFAVDFKLRSREFGGRVKRSLVDTQ